MESNYKQKLVSRLNRVEGQVNGIRKMIDNDKYCVDILNQIAAAQAALGRVGSLILENHLNHCVADAFASDSELNRRQKIQEILEVFEKYGRLGSR